jgi:hypothetical protein
MVPKRSVWWWLPAGAVWFAVVLLAVARMTGTPLLWRANAVTANVPNDANAAASVADLVASWSLVGSGRDSVFGELSGEQWAELWPGRAVRLSWSLVAGADAFPTSPDAHEYPLHRFVAAQLAHFSRSGLVCLADVIGVREAVRHRAGMQSTLSSPSCIRRGQTKHRPSPSGVRRAFSPVSTCNVLVGTAAACQAGCTTRIACRCVSFYSRGKVAEQRSHTEICVSLGSLEGLSASAEQ